MKTKCGLIIGASNINIAIEIFPQKMITFHNSGFHDFATNYLEMKWKASSNFTEFYEEKDLLATSSNIFIIAPIIFVDSLVLWAVFVIITMWKLLWNSEGSKLDWRRVRSRHFIPRHISEIPACPHITTMMMIPYMGYKGIKGNFPTWLIKYFPNPPLTVLFG